MKDENKAEWVHTNVMIFSLNYILKIPPLKYQKNFMYGTQDKKGSKNA